MWEGEVLKAFLLRHRFDIMSITLGGWINTWHGPAELHGEAKDWWMLPGWCCIAIAALEQGNGDSWYHMCAFRFDFCRKVNWNQASPQKFSMPAWTYIWCVWSTSAFHLTNTDKERTWQSHWTVPNPLYRPLYCYAVIYKNFGPWH